MVSLSAAEGTMPDNSGDNGLEKTVQIKRPSTVFEQMRLTLPSKAYLVIIGGMDMGSVIPVDQPRITLGRAPECTIVLQDESVSRVHAEVVQRETEGVLIRDLGSTNGTFLGGKRITESVLRKGDKVLLGRRTILKYEIYDQLDAVYQKKIYESSTRDGLTGVYNRRYFNQRIVPELSFTRRHSIWLSLLIFDLDNFKKINDVYGHQNGDHVLVSVTGAVSSILRTEDLLARYGGEEFTIIAPGTNYEGGLALGQRVRERVESEAIIPEESSGKVIKVTVSVGVIAVAPGFAGEPAAVIAAADGNLYEAKHGGRNNVVCSLLR
jgi:two-component system, cell cycle response regulator